MIADNLPAVRTEPGATLVARDTDSWADQLPAIVDLARSICGTDFVPESMRNNIPATAAAMLYGREIGLPPLTSLSNVNVISGRVGLSAVIMRAQVLAAGHEIRQDESTSAICKLSGRRRGTDYWQTVTYTMEDARIAGHLRNQQYAKNPRRMLRARATSELCELMFADVVRGMPSLDELEDYDDETPAGAPAAPAKTKVQRKTRTTTMTDDGAASGAATPTAGAGAPAAPSSPVPPLPGEPGFDGPDVGVAAAAPSADGETSVPATPASTPVNPVTGCTCGGPDGVSHWDAPPGPDHSTSCAIYQSSVPLDEGDLPPEVEREERPRMITRAMQKGMFGTFSTLGITDDSERLHITEAIIGRTPMHAGKPSSNGMTAAEAQTLIDALARCKTRDHVEALVQLAEQERADAHEHRTGDDA